MRLKKRLQSLIRKLLKRQLLKRKQQLLLKLRLRQAQLTVFHSGLQLPQLKQQLLQPLLQLQLSIPQMMAHRSIQQHFLLILLLFRVRFQVPASTGRILVMLRLRQPQVQVGSSLVGILPVQHIWQVIHRFQIHSLGLSI